MESSKYLDTLGRRSVEITEIKKCQVISFSIRNVLEMSKYRGVMCSLDNVVYSVRIFYTGLISIEMNTHHNDFISVNNIFGFPHQIDVNCRLIRETKLP